MPPHTPQISVDCLSWEFIVSTVDDSNLVYPPKVGVMMSLGFGAKGQVEEDKGRKPGKRRAERGVRLQVLIT